MKKKPVRIRIGDKFKSPTDDSVWEVIDTRPGGHVHLFERTRARFFDTYHRIVKNWERVGVLILLVSLSGCGGVLVRADEGQATWRAAFERCQAQASKESGWDKNAFIIAYQSCMKNDGWRYARAR